MAIFNSYVSHYQRVYIWSIAMQSLNAPSGIGVSKPCSEGTTTGDALWLKKPMDDTSSSFPCQTSYITIYYLVGGWPTPLKNMKVSWDYDIPNIWKIKTCSKPPTSYCIYIIISYRFVNQNLEIVNFEENFHNVHGFVWFFWGKKHIHWSIIVPSLVWWDGGLWGVLGA